MNQLFYEEKSKSFLSKNFDQNQERLRDQFYTAQDFDQELEEQLRLKDQLQPKRALDMDPEETLEYLKKGLKKFGKKTGNMINRLEQKIGSNKPNPNADLSQFQPTKKGEDLGNDIMFFEGGQVIEETPQRPLQNQNQPVNSNFFSGQNKKTISKTQDNTLADTPFLTQFIMENSEQKEGPDFLGQRNAKDDFTSFEFEKKKDFGKGKLENPDFLRFQTETQATPFD